MVTSAVLAMIAVMIFAAFDHTSRVRDRLGEHQERDHVARVALNKLGRDLRSAFLSAHVNVYNPALVAVATAFVGRDESPGDRLDMTTFSHRRLMRNSHEGDACEVGYRVETRQGGLGGYDLLRRESAWINADPVRGGTVDVLVPNIVSFNLKYYDQAADDWTDSWDTNGAQGARLPPRVRIQLVLSEHDGRRLTYMTEATPMIQDVLRFGLPIDYR